MSAEEISIVQTGWGIKQCGNGKKWKKRWLVLLSNSCMRYFPDKFAADEQGHFDVPKNADISVGAPVSEGIPVIITTNDCKYFIAFPTDEEACGWCQKIIEVKNSV